MLRIHELEIYLSKNIVHGSVLRVKMQLKQGTKICRIVISATLTAVISE